jgi:predicted esterase
MWRIALLSLLLVTACDDGDAGAGVVLLLMDMGTTDAAPDLARVDADVADAMPDASAPDASAPDASAPDAAPPAVSNVPAAEPPVYGGGACPTFEAGRAMIESAGLMRAFDLFLPPSPEGAPLLFIWHPLGSNAGQIGRFFNAANIAAERGWIVAVPESRRLQTEWGFIGDSAPDEALFDDLLACLDAQFDVDNDRVYTTGFSAGALWSSYLILHRSEYLNAALVLSGGINNFVPYNPPAFDLPVLLTWGGPNDQYGGVINFQETTFIFRDRLSEDGHPVITCEHAGGHVPPPGVASWGIDWLAGHTQRRAAHVFSAEDAPYPDSCTVVE